MIVHHGLFWERRIPDGKRYELLRQLVETTSPFIVLISRSMRIRSATAQLCCSLGFRNLQPFFFERTVHWISNSEN
jgi:hypothetical protein